MWSSSVMETNRGLERIWLEWSVREVYPTIFSILIKYLMHHACYFISTHRCNSSSSPLVKVLTTGLSLLS